ncbi:Cation/calcium exchanger like [Quillaja saponaria]|uniref:Cation/calcium exchanger like n=1 Tax=Quillaja saponaria TaxID=32244 RepID=A0AAD7L9Z7_QUISA|nr:Cation/calcium exchanger like [Quillaja saponaria]KAJ7954265.1 Cation/calcium exchanger like [Quillaja saponaria]
MAFTHFSVKTSALTLTLLSILVFFLINPPFSPSFFPTTPRRSLLTDTTTTKTLATTSCSSSNYHSDGLVNYLSLHFCIFHGNLFLSIPSLALFLLLQFYILIKTAQCHFSVVTTKLSGHLNLSPSMAAVTLLALGNGAPDVFASVAALRGGQYRTGFGAILSAGTCVSAFVVGFVAIYAAPFSVDPTPFVRDILFYLIAALFLFYVYLSSEIFLWQAVGFVGFYLFFVGFVFYMDLGMGSSGGNSGSQVGFAGDVEEQRGANSNVKVSVTLVEKKLSSGLHRALEMVSAVWKLPVSFFLKLTIPQPAPSEWSRFYASANIALCPLALLYACNSFMPFNYPIVFLLPNTHFPLWLVVLFTGFSLAFLHFITEREPPKTEQMLVVLIAFVMSVFWISTTAGELLNCLAALGVLLKLPPALLGLTVLAWGNSVGDLVADVAIAKAGHPAMAMAGCFAGPMFNMLVGLGTALVMQTASVYPEAYELHFHVGIVIAFVFLLLSLMGSLLVITWCRFRVPRFWGYCLVSLYTIFTAVSLLIAMFSR